jgi:hypothetical protein
MTLETQRLNIRELISEFEGTPSRPGGGAQSILSSPSSNLEKYICPHVKYYPEGERAKQSAGETFIIKQRDDSRRRGTDR